MTVSPANPLGLKGLSFLEYASPRPAELEQLFRSLGFSQTRRHKSLAVDLFEQHDVRFLVNREAGSFAEAFARLHGPCISAMGLEVEDARFACAEAVKRGAKPFVASPATRSTVDCPAILGIGDSLIYFTDKRTDVLSREFGDIPNATRVPSLGFLTIDHLTNNVPKGTLRTWADFYERVFGFTEVRAFDIRGAKTGLYSFALRSPCGTFCIPINEGTESKSQIEEYLREYNGAGIQHVALLTTDLLASLDGLAGKVATLDIDDDYYATVFDRVPRVKEDPKRIQKHQVLVDGDEEGYLLQIFTQNVIGPIFFEFIQRENHLSFGEGNFGALFRSIERDQQRRGVL